ncbi:condensin-2 complex subunit D3-like [Branchiostoma floridae x Branchiostoma japonicum]
MSNFPDVCVRLGIGALQKDWVDQVWDCDFTICDPPAEECGISIDRRYNEQLLRAMQQLARYSNEENAEHGGQDFWSLLTDHDLSYRNIIALAFYCIYTGQQRVSSVVEKEAACLATSLYFNLLQVPGSGAYGTFHAVLFEKAMNVLKHWPQAGGNKRKHRSDGTEAQGKKPPKAPRRGGQPQGRDEDMEQEGERDGENADEDDSDDEEVVLSAQEMTKIKQLLIGCLKDLIRLLRCGHFSLKERQDSTQHALETLVFLTRVELTNEELSYSTDMNLGHVSSLTQLAYMMLLFMLLLLLLLLLLDPGVPDESRTLVYLTRVELTNEELSYSTDMNLGHTLVSLTRVELTNEELSYSTDMNLGHTLVYLTRVELTNEELSYSTDMNLGHTLVYLTRVELTNEELSYSTDMNLGHTLVSLTRVELTNEELSYSTDMNLGHTLVSLTRVELTNEELSYSTDMNLGHTLVSLTRVELTNEELSYSTDMNLGHTLVSLTRVELTNEDLSYSTDMNLGHTLVSLTRVELTNEDLSYSTDMNLGHTLVSLTRVELTNEDLSYSTDMNLGHTLVSLTRVELTNEDLSYSMDMNLGHVSSLTQLAYMATSILSTGAHGEVTAVVTCLFRLLLPNVLMMGEGGSVAPNAIPQALQVISAQAVGYACHLARQGGEAVMPVYRILLQHSCWRVPDKAEYRTRVSQSVVKMLQALPTPAYASFLEWLYRFSRSTKIGHRTFGLDMALALLPEPEREIDDNVQDDHLIYLTRMFLLEKMIMARCSDVAPNVRGRALSCLSQCISSENPSIILLFQDFFASTLTKTPGVQRSNTPLTGNSTALTPLGMTPSPGANTPQGESPAPRDVSFSSTAPGGTQNLFTMLGERLNDDKVGVRKAALQAFESLVSISPTPPSVKEVEIIYQRCMDVSLSVRKQALQSLTAVLHKNPTLPHVHKLWLEGVVPAVMDRETTCSEKSLELLEDTILEQIDDVGKSQNEDSDLAWNLLKVIAGIEGQELRRYLGKACNIWSRQGKLTARLLKALSTHVSSDHTEAAWMMMALVAKYCPKMDYSMVLDNWQGYRDGRGVFSKDTVSSILQVMGSIAGNIPKHKINEIMADLKKLLRGYSCDPGMIKDLVWTLEKLTKGCSKEPEEARAMMDEWATELLRRSEEYLSSLVLNEDLNTANLDVMAVVRHLFTVGEVAQLCPAKTSKRIILMVQSFLVDNTKLDELPSSQGTQLSQMPGSQMSQMPLSQAGSQLSQMPSQMSQIPLSQLQGPALPPTIRAHAILTIGKLCLQHDDVAKKCVPFLAHELETSPHIPIRNNVMVILCDLIKLYSTYIDHHIPAIAACLKDESPLIRNQTLIMLTQLLQEDFMKWKGTLFFRFVSVLVDPDEDTRKSAEFCLVHLLSERQPGMYFNNFVQCVYHLNSYQHHPVYNKFNESERERKMFSLAGEANREKRRTIYRFLLEHMTDENRFNLIGKLCSEVLEGFVDNVLPLNAETSQILQDTLSILSCKEIKLASLKANAEEDALNEGDAAGAAFHRATNKFLTQVVKKNMIENIVPIIIALKHQLEAKRSPLLRSLMVYLKEVMKDYRNEVKDIMAADKQLASEIEFDLRRFDEQQREQEEERQRRKSVGTPGAAATPAAGGPTPSAPGSAPGAPGTPQRHPGQEPGAVPRTPAGALGARQLNVLAIINSARKNMSARRGVRVTEQPDGGDGSPNTNKASSPANQPQQPDTQQSLQSLNVDTPSVTQNALQPTNIDTPTTPPGTPGKPQSPSPKPPARARPGDASPLLPPARPRTPLRSAGFATPERTRQPCRAISTPDNTIQDITFQAPFDVSAITPIVASGRPRRVPSGSERSPSLDTETDTDGTEVMEKMAVICLKHPEAVEKPVEWKVVTPNKTRQRTRSRPQSSSAEETENQPGGSTRRSARTRTPRASNS